MTSYVVLKIMEPTKIKPKKLQLTGLNMNPKLKSRNEFIAVREITIVNKSLQNNVMCRRFDVAFRRVFTISMNVLEDTDITDGDIKLALDEILKIKKVLKEKYKHKVTMEEYHQMWKKTDFLEKKLMDKLILQQNIQQMIKNMMQEVPEEKKGIKR